MKSLIVIAALSLGLAGCGKEIGDSCVLATDCDINGTRTCDLSQTGGYCTIMGCDYNTCPTEAVCVGFLMGSFDNQTCTYATDGVSTFDCTPDELCTLDGHCAPSANEIRYCMRKCNKDSDCRSGYECRDMTKMEKDGGMPILAPGQKIDSSTPKFCALAP